MPTPEGPSTRTFRELVFSDYARHRPGRPRWIKVLALCLTAPGMLASIVLRAQQRLHDTGRVRAASVMRTVSTVLVGADFGAGMRIGTGLLLAHPVGVTIGYGLTIGDGVTFAGGVTCAARSYDETDTPQEFATIGDGAILGANAVLVGGVTIGDDAVVGANSVVLSDVPPGAVVFGSPARRVGTHPRKD